jgi:hypothetical protein
VPRSRHPRPSDARSPSQNPLRASQEVRTPAPKQVWVPFRRFCPVAEGVGRDGTPSGQACTADSGHNQKKRSQIPCSTKSSSSAASDRTALETNGWTPESHVTVLADGADGLNNLVCAATEKATRKILDWFHISMRLRHIEQMSRGMVVVADRSQAVLLKELLVTKLPNVRYQMWNGQWRAALDRMGALYRASAHLQNCSPYSDAERVRRFREHLVNLRDYLCRNWSGLTNYAR